MSMFAAILLTISALLHVGWNLLSKKIHPSSAFFLTANTIACLFLSPILVIYIPVLPLFPPEIWALILITGCFQAIYMWGLAGAYRHGAISVAYPLLRSLPVLFVALLTSIFNQGEKLTTVAILGVILIAIGCFLIPIQSFRHIKASTFFNLSCLFALVSAIGTIGYTLIDDRALMILRETQALQLTIGEISLLYILLESISCSLWLLLFIITNNNSRGDLEITLRKNKLSATLTGLAMLSTYYLVLTSMSFVENVSYVVAFRQLSIPIAVILGVYLLKEYKSIFKLIGTAATFTGIILTSLG